MHQWEFGEQGSKWIKLFFQIASRNKVHQCISFSPPPHLQLFFCSAYGPLHTPFSIKIENKPRFCSKPSFMRREDQTLWKQRWKATSSGWFLLQLLENSILFSLPSQTRFVVRLVLVHSSWIWSWKRRQLCKGVDYDGNVPTQNWIYYDPYPNSAAGPTAVLIHIIFIKDSMKFHYFLGIYPDWY